MREVITTLRQDNASLKQRLAGYEQRLKTLEQSRVGGAHPETSLVGVQNTTPVGSAHNTTPEREASRSPVSKAHMAPQTDFAGRAGPCASLSPVQTDRIKGPRDAPAYNPQTVSNSALEVVIQEEGANLCPSDIAIDKGSTTSKT